MSYNILLLGGGGREHAMAAHIVKSPKCNQLFKHQGMQELQNLAQILILQQQILPQSEMPS